MKEARLNVFTMEMKKCKECGDLFMPKSKNSVYCDKLHYRPCPVCGKPVEAKYLSDPARCCSQECKKAARMQAKSKVMSKVVSSITLGSVKLDESAASSVTVSNPAVGNKTSAFGALAAAVNNEEVVASSEYSTVRPAQQLIQPVPYFDNPERDIDFEESLRDTNTVRMYVGKNTSLKFVPGHEYALEVNKTIYGYEVEAVYDFTTGKSASMMMPLSSQISINQQFVIVNRQ